MFLKLSSVEIAIEDILFIFKKLSYSIQIQSQTSTNFIIYEITLIYMFNKWDFYWYIIGINWDLRNTHTKRKQFPPPRMNIKTLFNYVLKSTVYSYILVSAN